MKSNRIGVLTAGLFCLIAAHAGEGFAQSASKDEVVYFDAQGQRKTLTLADLDADDYGTLQSISVQVADMPEAAKKAGCTSDCIMKWAVDNVVQIEKLMAGLRAEESPLPACDLNRCPDLNVLASQIENITKRNQEIDKKIALLRDLEPKLDPAAAVGIQWVDFKDGGFDFRMAKFTVTVAQYKVCVAANRCTVPDSGGACSYDKPGYDDYPVTCVDAEQMGLFAKWVGARLPTNAEWQYAATSEGKYSYPWGNEDPTHEKVVYTSDPWANEEPNAGKIKYGSDAPRPVCSKPAGNTDRGLCDMRGNVWQPVTEFELQSRRTRRGGAFDTRIGIIRLAYDIFFPDSRDSNTGFRLVR